MTAQAPSHDQLELPNFHQDARSQQTSLLLRRAWMAEQDERRELYAQVIELHLNVAASVAWRYRGRGMEHQDLVQIARLGLVEAVTRFDPDRGPFLAFATPTMVGHVKRHFRDHGWVVRPPRPVQEKQLEISRAQDDLSHQLRRNTTDIASHLNFTEQDVREAANLAGCFNPTSLDAPHRDRGSDFGHSYADTLGETQPEMNDVDTLATIEPACRVLPPDDRHLLFLRFFLLRSQSEIGAELGISQMQVSRRLRRILMQLRTAIGELEAPAAGIAG
jgi:RNA polymerase sigma-B factor